MRRIDYKCEPGYEIRFAKYEDIDNIMTFIKEYWKETHILAHDRAFFEYEFLHGDEVAFVLLIKSETNTIEGTLGYIPYNDHGERDMFTVVWKVLNDGNDLFAGVGLLNYLMDYGRCRHLFSSGINPTTRSIYKYMGFQVEDLKQYYRLSDRETYKIARIVNKEILPVKENEAYLLQEIENFDMMKEVLFSLLKEESPLKSVEFVKKRYFEHPIYQYRNLILKDEKKEAVLLLIMREVQVEDTKILRIVDIFGEKEYFQFAGAKIDRLLREGKYEYIDFMQYGIQDKIMKAAGFSLRKKGDSNIIPNYFEPFLQENIDVGIFFEKGLFPCIVKGDGDQDRPSNYYGDCK